MKKIFFLCLLSITAATQKNYSQTLNRNQRKQIKINCFCEEVLVMKQTKLDKCYSNINKSDSIALQLSKAYCKTYKNYMNPGWINTGATFNAEVIYVSIEDLYKRKWEQAMKGASFSYGY